MAVFLTNPFFGDINPGTADGAKLYNKAIEAPKDTLSIQQSKARDVQSQFETDACNFGWSSLIGNITINIANEVRNILSNTRELTVEMLQKHARTTWGNLAPWADPLPMDFDVRAIDPATHAAQRPHFYRRVRSTMIAKRIEASLDSVSRKSLFLDKKKFQWTETNGTINNDGPTMLFLIVTKINPSVRVGISTLKMNLMTATLPKFEHSIPDMIDYMVAQMNDITDMQATHEDFTLNLFTALDTTHNDEFRTFIATEKNTWETSTLLADDRVTADLLIQKVNMKYNNMSKANQWKKTEDPSSKVISALVTKVQSLEDKLGASKNSSAHATSTGPSKLRIPVWRTIKEEESVTRDGKTWHWCTKHKKEGLFDGLYMPHKECDHDEWAKQKNEYWKNKKSSNSTNADKSANLTLSDSLKQALMTEANMTEEQAAACWTKVSGN